MDHWENENKQNDILFGWSSDTAWAHARIKLARMLTWSVISIIFCHDRELTSKSWELSTIATLMICGPTAPYYLSPVPPSPNLRHRCPRQFFLSLFLIYLGTSNFLVFRLPLTIVSGLLPILHQYRKETYGNQSCCQQGLLVLERDEIFTTHGYIGIGRS